jgi:hypothetical protein
MEFDEKQEMKFLKFLYDKRRTNLSKQDIKFEISPEIGPAKFEELFEKFEKKDFLLKDIVDAKRGRLYNLSNTGCDYYTHTLEKNQEEQESETSSRISRLIQKYWWALIIIGWVGGCCTDIGKEVLRRKIWPESNQSQRAIPACTDTSKTHRTK